MMATKHKHDSNNSKKKKMRTAKSPDEQSGRSSSPNINYFVREKSNYRRVRLLYCKLKEKKQARCVRYAERR